MYINDLCEFTFMSAVFQTYQDGKRVVMKDWVQWDPVDD